MGFITLQAGFYLKKKISDQEALESIKEIFQAVNNEKILKFKSLDKNSKKIIEHTDASLLQERGLIFLSEVKRVKKINKERLDFHLYIVNDYPNCTFIQFAPILSLFDTETVKITYSIIQTLAYHFIKVLNPYLAQINGLGEENDMESIIHPAKWDFKSLPSFLTPFNYIHKDLLNQKKVSELPDDVKISDFHQGLLIEFVESIEIRPSQDLETKLKRWLSSDMPSGYSHIRP